MIKFIKRIYNYIFGPRKIIIKPIDTNKLSKLSKHKKNIIYPI
jgi:hypothetical protein